ncbi:hypothetical protein [Dysgonomonas sp. HGC4]|uniref:hypothetical protein n=1 Tax=Dysgonomonas sp. HGC4 TaxID=1658009 RepID=UPI000680EAD8|nr:hypothetical protein [Dysgonomonas sp. HGC4]MBD8348358.1 hypothetical protein [Dysgonomonas sp. HGC4]
MGATLTDEDVKNLLDRLSTKERYKQVMSFLDDSDRFYPFSVEEMKMIVKKGKEDGEMGLGKTSEEMRNKHPR